MWNTQVRILFIFKYTGFNQNKCKNKYVKRYLYLFVTCLCSVFYNYSFFQMIKAEAR